MMMMIIISVSIIIIFAIRYVSRDYVVANESDDVAPSNFGELSVINNLNRERTVYVENVRDAPLNASSIHTYFMTWLTWFVVVICRPSCFVRVPVLGRILRSKTWRGMKVQSPSCVLFEPFPRIPRRLCYVFWSVPVIVAVYSSITIAVSMIILGIFLSYQSSNTYKSGNPDDETIMIESGAYVGYEGIVFKLDQDTKQKPWIMTRGHADRSALLRLVRKRKKELYWNSDQDTMQCQLDSNGNIDPTIFCLRT